MNASLVLSAALLAPAAPVPRDTAPNTTGPAPRVLALKADAGGAVRVTGTIPTKVTVTNTHFVIENVVENGNQVQKQVQKQVEQDIVTSQYFSKTLSEFNGKFTTADGTPLTLEEATARVKNGATMLASADGKPIAPSWLRSVGPDTVVMVADGLSHAQPQWGGAPLPTTPAPRLALYGTDASGKLMAPCTSQPFNSDYSVYDDFAWEGGGRAFRGKMIRGGFDSGYYPAPSQVQATVVFKPLTDVKFDAYDVNGKLVSKNDVLKRLAAGGMVLVAGDNRLPDDTYLKAFKDDVLVLVGPELVLPVAPVDQTKKKDPAKTAPAPAVQVAPVAPAILKPAVIIKGRAAVAPAIEKVGEDKQAEDKEAEAKRAAQKAAEEKKKAAERK
jgi:hypothetical protein